MGLVWIKNTLRKLPLIGGLIDCRWIDHIEAFKEFFINLVFSAMPIWLGGMIIYAMDKSIEKSLWKAVVNTFFQGELFMYAAAMVAPIMYMALKPEKNAPNFPGQIGHIVIISLIGVTSAVFFALQRTGVWLDMQFIFPMSVFLYISSLFLLYLATVYRNYRATGAVDASRQQTQDFVEEFNNRHT